MNLQSYLWSHDFQKTMRKTLFLICVICLSGAMGQYEFQTPAECQASTGEEGLAEMLAIAKCFEQNKLTAAANAANDTCVFLQDIAPCYSKACCETFQTQWNDASNANYNQMHGLCTKDISINCNKYQTANHTQTAQTSPPPPPPSSTPSPPTASVPSPPPNTQQTSSASLRGTNCMTTFITLVFVIAIMILK